MAKDPCKYQLPGSDVWMSELEFKKALVDGLLDQLVMESGVSIPSLKGFSPEPQRAESFKLRGARGAKMTEDASLKSGQEKELVLSETQKQAYEKLSNEDKKIVDELINDENYERSIGAKEITEEGNLEDQINKSAISFEDSLNKVLNISQAKETISEDTEVFTFGNTKYDINKANEIISQESLPTVDVPVDVLPKMSYSFVSVDESTVNNADITKPVIIAKTKDGLLLIDGHHRVRKAIQDNKPIKAIVLDENQTAQVTGQTGLDESIGKTSIKEKSKSIAENIRNIKIDTKGTAMSSLPGLVEAWNLSVEAAAKAVEVAGATADAIGKGIAAAEKAFKESDFYKNLKDRDEKLRYMNDLRNGIQQTLEEDKPTGKQKKAGKEFKGKVEEVTGVKPSQRMVTMTEANALKTRIRAEMAAAKDATKALSETKQQVIDFAKGALPKESYTQKEISQVLNAVKRAKNEKSLNAAVDSVMNLVEKKNEQTRKRKASDIKKKIKDKRTLYTKVNGKWKGKVSVDAQNEFNEFIGQLADLDAMSMEELVEVEEIINGIVDNGKADFNRLKAIQEDRKMREAADMLEELAGKPDAILSDNEAVEIFLDQAEGGYVIIDGKMYNKSSYAKSPYKNKVNPEPIDGPVKGYKAKNLPEIKRILDQKGTPLSRLKYNLKRAAVLDNMYGYLQKIGKNASKTTEFINKNIIEPVQDYFIDSQVAFKNRMDSYRKGLKDIFGSEKAARNRLNEKSPVNPLRTSREKGVDVTNSMLVSLYNVSRTENGMDRLDKSGVDAQDLVDYIESNEDLLDYANFLVDQYNEMRAEYEPTYIAVTGMPFPEGYYYPTYSEANFDDDTLSLNDIIDTQGNFAALNAMANNLKRRTDKTGKLNTSLGAEEVFIDYVKNMERAKALIPVAKAANQLFAQQNRPYLVEKISPEELADLQKQLAVIFTGKRPPKVYGEQATNAFMNYTVIGTLGFKLKSIPTQLSSFVNFWGQGIEDGISPIKVITAFPKNAVEREFLTEVVSSTYLKERRQGTSLDLEVKRILNTKNKTAAERQLAKIYESGMKLPGFADYLSNISPLGGGGSYAIAQLRNELAKGLPLEEAKRNAFRKYVKGVEETQQPSTEDYTSSFQRSTFGRMLSTYKTSQIGFARKIVKGFRTLGDSKATDKQKVQAYYDIIWYSVFSSILFNLVSNAGGRVLWGSEGDDEEFNEEARVIYDLTMDETQSVAQGFGIPGFILDQAINHARQDDWKNNVPLIDFLLNISEAGSSVFNRYVNDELYQYESNGEIFDAKISPEERLRFLEEMGLAAEGGGGYLEKVEQMYRDASVWRRMSEKERNQLLKTAQVKNIVKQAEDFYEFSKGEKSFMDAFMGYEEDYFKSAKSRNKTDYLFKFFVGEDYIPNKKERNKSPEYIGKEMEPREIKENEIPESEINN